MAEENTPLVDSPAVEASLEIKQTHEPLGKSDLKNDDRIVEFDEYDRD